MENETIINFITSYIVQSKERRKNRLISRSWNKIIMENRRKVSDRLLLIFSKEEYDIFSHIALETNLCLSGSLVLQTLLNEYYHKYDVDLWCECGGIINYCKITEYLLSIGFIEKDNFCNYNGTWRCSKLLRNGIWFDVIHIPKTERSEELNKSDCTIFQKRVVNSFYATHVMNFWYQRNDTILSYMPWKTLSRIAHLKVKNIDEKVNNAILKYKKRGFIFKSKTNKVTTKEDKWVELY